MPMLSSVQQALLDQLSRLSPFQGILPLEVSLTAAELTSLLPLLASNGAKSQFPHFFLQRRDQAESLATLGEIRRFQNVDEAQQFASQTNFRLFGGLPFEGEACFILPRCLFWLQDNQLSVTYYVENLATPEQLALEAVKIRDFFADLTTSPSLHLSPLTLTQSHSASDFAQWQTNIERVITGIKQGEFRKVVLANATTLTFNQPISPYALLQASQQINQGCYHFLWAFSAQNAFIGSSPERLYQRVGTTFFTEALAGTVAVTASPVQTELNAQWLLTDPKNLYENQLVVDDIAQQLADNVADFSVEPAQIKRLHNVQHLRRPIRAELNAGMTDAICLSKMHPTAAVAGLPRQVAKKFILQNEAFSRGWYAGTLGFFSPNEAEFCVTLRSADIQQHQITLYAGAGIVEASQAEAEWLEIARKSRALAALLFSE